MSEAEIDALVARLVPEFEITKQAALAARQEYVDHCTGSCVNRARAFAAHRRWQHLEAVCQAILRKIDELAECNAA